MVYKDMVKLPILNLPSFTKVRIEYVLYPKTKRKTDVANVCSIHDKFFSDALVELGKLPEDNYEHLVEVTYRFGHVDKDNPRVDITITEVD
ncbi:hypothetical protein pVco7_gp105 [Vibrio phage pVco-7]